MYVCIYCVCVPVFMPVGGSKAGYQCSMSSAITVLNGFEGFVYFLIYVFE